MKNIQLVDTHFWEQLKPITLTRSVADIRLGILTIKEKWEAHGFDVNISTLDYLQPLYQNNDFCCVKVNSAILPDRSIITQMDLLKEGESLWKDEIWIATNGEKKSKKYLKGELSYLAYPEDIFIYAGQEIQKDINLIYKESLGQNLSHTNTVLGNHKVFISKSARVECCILNTEDGAIYIGEGANVMEGSILKGPISIGHHTTVKMGARLYPNTSIGPWCKVGGEIKNSVVLGYSNKAHDGYMGNSVIGEWCNWGADTNNSNMKNNYTEVKLWDYSQERFRNTGHQFVGSIMGDHSKTGINTMFNTGTVIGVSCNIYNSGFPRQFIPSFSWGGAHGFKTYLINKALETAKTMQIRKGIDLAESERVMLMQVYKESAKFRMWERK